MTTAKEVPTESYTIEPELILDPKEFLNSTTLLEPIEAYDKLEASTSIEKVEISQKSSKEEQLERTPQKSQKITRKINSWKEQLINTMRKIHEEVLGYQEKIILYYQIGKWIANPSVQHREKIFKVKNEIDKALGLRLTK